MSIVGIDRMTYGVADLEKCSRYFADWGLTKVAGGKERNLFRTEINSEVLVLPRGDKSLPKAVGGGSTVREITWGVKTKRDLQRLAAELTKDRAVREDRDGTIHAVDPLGLGIAFRVTHRQPYEKTRAPINAPGKVERRDQRATFYDKAIPQSIGHSVWMVNDPSSIKPFYTDRLGFCVTDQYQDNGGFFMRCATDGGHHNHVLFKSMDGKQRLDHVAFLVRDVNEVFAGGINFSQKGYKTAVGPGRHWMSSAYFWYFACPAGGMTEYFTDEDHMTKGWKPQTFERSRATFAEWFMPKGLKV